jgi:hypothetical protein
MLRDLFPEADEFLAQLPGLKRRWQVTIFRNEPVEGGIQNSVVHQYENVRSKWISGNIVDHDGVLQFIDANGKEVVARSVPFLAKEVTAGPEGSAPDAETKQA